MCFGWSPAQTIMAENNRTSRAAFSELIGKVLSLLLAAQFGKHHRQWDN